MSAVRRVDPLPRAPLAVAALLLSLACSSPPAAPDYGRPLPPGAPALLPLADDEPRPPFARDWERRDELAEAVRLSIEWMGKPSARTHFPIAGVDYDRALASLERFEEILRTARSASTFAARLEREFDVYKSAGWDGRGGGVLFTGYCTPILEGSLERTERYRYPLYALPPDLEKDASGLTLGRRTPSGLEPYPDRRTIERRGLLEGQGLELAWLANPMDAYIAHVNGSAVVELPDGALFRLGYAGKNGHEYRSLRDALIDAGEIDAETAGLATIRAWAAAEPERVTGFLHRNPSYVFFTPIDGNPRGSLNVPVTAERTLATDKSLFPRGALVFVEAAVGAGAQAASFERFMLDQDTGGAIRTAGRADIYLGVGPDAERLAGATTSPGQLYYLFLRG